MTTPAKPVNETTPKRKPGLMVEDRNAAVRTDEKGAQKVVKTADRSGEALRQGKTESQV